jgi:hypothetical protein
LPQFPARRSMVRGSTVRVRLRALEKPRSSGFFFLYGDNVLGVARLHR